MTGDPHPPRAGGRPRLEAFAAASLIVLAVGAIGVLLYYARAAFVPIAFSMLIALVLSTPVEALHRRGVSRGLGATLILLAFLGIAGGTLGAVWAPARAWVAGLPRTIELIEQRLGPMAHALEHVVMPNDKPARAPEASERPSAEQFAMAASGSLLVATPAAVMAAVTVAILTLFLLAGGAAMLARVAATLSSDSQVMHVLGVVEHVRSEVARYYATLTLINIGLGAATAAMTLALGLPNPLLWGTMAMLLNFIPYAGSATTLLVLTLVSFVTFDSLGRVFAVVASFLVLVTIEGQVVEPLLIGRRLKLSPIVVFLALWFGGWFWGISGVFLALPTLVALKVVAEHNRNGRMLVALLSPSPHRPFKLVRGQSDPAAQARPPAAPPAPPPP